MIKNLLASEFLTPQAISAGVGWFGRRQSARLSCRAAFMRFGQTFAQARRKALEEHWRLARETEAKLTAAMEKKLAEYKKHLTANLKSLPMSQQLRFFRCQRLQAEERVLGKQDGWEGEALAKEEACRQDGHSS